MTVEDNKITEGDFEPDITQGTVLNATSEGGDIMLLMDKGGEPILTSEPQASITSYTLPYSGKEIEEVLDFTAKGTKADLWLEKEIDNIKTEIDNKADKASVEDDILVIN